MNNYNNAYGVINKPNGVEFYFELDLKNNKQGEWYFIFYTKKGINILAFIISFCILIIINLVYSYFQNVDLGVWLKKDKYEEAFIIEEEFNEKIQQINKNWNIRIPKI